MPPEPSDQHSHRYSDAGAGVRPPDDESPGKGPPDKSQRALAAPAFAADSRTNLNGKNLEPGRVYLVKERRPDFAFAILRNSREIGLPCLIITRQYPERLRQERGLKDVRVLWLTHAMGEDFHDPTALGTLAKVVQKFIEDNNGEGVILLYGLEFLIINNGFLQTLMFVEHVNEFIMQHKAITVLSVDPDSLEEKEFALLERNAKVINPERLAGGTTSVVIVPLDEAILAACERLQRELTPVLAVVDRTAQSAEKKVAQALHDGVAFVVLVEGWAGKGGTYRVIRPHLPMVRLGLEELKRATARGAGTTSETAETPKAADVRTLEERASGTIASLAEAHHSTVDAAVRERQEQALWEFATNPVFGDAVHDLALGALRKILADRPRTETANESARPPQQGGERAERTNVGTVPPKPATPPRPATPAEEVTSDSDTSHLGKVIAGWERDDGNPDLWRKTFPNGDRVSIESAGQDEYHWRVQRRTGRETHGAVHGNLADAAREALADRNGPRNDVGHDGTRRIMAKVCMVGDPVTEKTSLIRRYVSDNFDDRYITTLGSKVSRKELRVTVPGKAGAVMMAMNIWDIMGQKGFRELAKEAYFHGAKGILAVCDATRKKTLEDLDDWIEGVYSVTGRIPVVILANHADRVAQLQLTEQDLERAAAPYGGHFFFTSSETGQNVEAAFQQLAQLIVESGVGAA